MRQWQFVYQEFQTSKKPRISKNVNLVEYCTFLLSETGIFNTNWDILLIVYILKTHIYIAIIYINPSKYVN